MSTNLPDDSGVPDGLAFTSENVMQLTGATARKLSYWIHTGVISPSVDRAIGRGRVRLFSFSDLLEVKVAVWLRDTISLQLIRKIVARLRSLGLDSPLGTVRFGVVEERAGAELLSQEVILQMPDGKWESAKRPGQLILELAIPIREFSDALHHEVLERRRRVGRVGQIERRRGALGSTPVVAGTRVPTRSIWNLHKSGASVESILASYPGLHAGDVEAALAAEERRRRPSA